MLVVSLGGTLLCSAQAAADNQTSVIPTPPDKISETRPRTIRDTLEKMRIEREKKEFEQMLGRSKEAVKITEEVETSFTKKGRLTEKEIAKLGTVEKLAKQIRKDLGGADDKEQIQPRDGSYDSLDAIKSLRSLTEDLFDELKKMTRFSISAAAIQSTNAVLRLTRFLQISR